MYFFPDWFLTFQISFFNNLPFPLLAANVILIIYQNLSLSCFPCAGAWPCLLRVRHVILPPSYTLFLYVLQEPTDYLVYSYVKTKQLTHLKVGGWSLTALDFSQCFWKWSNVIFFCVNSTLACIVCMLWSSQIKEIYHFYKIEFFCLTIISPF